MSQVRNLLAARAFEEAARRAWVEVHIENNPQASLYGAAAYLWLHDQSNTIKMLAIAADQRLPGVDLLVALEGMAHDRAPPPNFPTLLHRVFVEDSVLASFVSTLLVRLESKHGFAFASAMDWRPLPLSATEFSPLAEAVLGQDFEAGVRVVAQYLSSFQPDARSYLPPVRYLMPDRIAAWRNALQHEAAPPGARLCTTVEKAFFANETVHQPTPPADEKIVKAQTVTLAIAEDYPLLAAHLLLGLARKGEGIRPISKTLEAYRRAVRMLETNDDGYRWIRQEMVTRARRKLGLATGQAGAETEPEMRLLILGCVAIGDALAGVILADMLRREYPSRMSAVFAAWICLCLKAPSWSDLGFRQLGYVPPEFAASFPQLPYWPYRPLDEDELAPWRDARKSWPRISVVVPSYQQGQFLEQTLLSLLHQGYPDLEILLEDGGSTDESVEIIERYRARLHHVRSGPDNGQSDALNQGLARATGELLGWLNSDDMLAPLALFHVAQVYLDGADVVAGSCFEFRDAGFIQMNLPGVSAGPLQQRSLANLKDEWFLGRYFYQPEVFFSAEAYRRAGGRIDVDLHYTMDYDLWMRLAGIHAKLAKATWPVALFRRHGEQKTSNLDRTVIEQGDVRWRYVPQVTRRSHVETAKERLAAVFAKDRIRVLVATGKYGRFFPVGYEKEIAAAFADSRFQVEFHVADASLRVDEYDVVVLLITLTPNELAFLQQAKAGRGKALLVGWFWDNHHMFRENMEFAGLLDIGVAGHHFARAYLESPTMWLLPSIPLCYTQWSGRVLDQLGEHLGMAARSNELYGGFVSYADMPERSRQVELLQETGHFPKLRLIDPHSLAGYYDLSQGDRLIDWCSYKVSLAANVERDVPIRFFDALVAGQIPVLPSSALDEPWLREQYPDELFVTCRSMRPDDVREALATALEMFDSGGPKGVAARVMRARQRHSFVARLGELLDGLKAAAHD